MSHSSAGARRCFAACSVLAMTAAMALFASGAVAAEAPPVQIDPETADYGTRVDELVVTGTAGAAVEAPVKASLEATQPQSIINRETIDRFVPVTADFTQIVNLSPSVSGTAYNGAGLSEAKSTLRGFSDGEYNITYDGIPWGDANGPSHHSTSFFPSSTIGAVVVDRGPGAASQLGQATFGGSINLFSPTVSNDFGGSQTVTFGSWNTVAAVTKFNTGDIDALNGAHALFNFQELKTDGYLTYNKAEAYNQLVRVVVPLVGNWSVTALGTWNSTRVNTSDKAGATLTQVALYGKNFALDNNPNNPTYYKYNTVEKHTWFNYLKLAGNITPSLSLENTLYSYYYKNDTESALDVTLSPADIAAKKGLQVVPVSGGPTIVNGHIPGYTKLNVYDIRGDILHLDQTMPFGAIKAGLWLEEADTGPRARYDYDASSHRAPDYRQKAVPGVPRNVEYLQYSGWRQYQPFVDVVWDVTPQLTLTPGIKYVHFDLSVDSDVNQKSRQPYHGSRTFEKTLGFFTANYKIQDNWSVYGQWATGFLVPDISITQIANPNIDAVEPQESINYQVGTVFQSGDLTFDADVYYIDFKNKIQSRFNALSGENETFNLGGAIYKGVEGAVTWRVNGDLYVFVNGSLNSAETKGEPTLGVVGGKQIAGAPKSTAAAGLIYTFNDLTLTLVDKFTGEQWTTEGEPGAYHLGGFHSADMKLIYSFDRYRIEGAVYNIFDSQKTVDVKPGKTVPYDQYYYQPERNVQVSLKVNF